MPNVDRTNPRWRVGVAASGLGHVNRGIESWANDLAAALSARGMWVRLYKGASASQAYERHVRCARRAGLAAAYFQRLLPARVGWRLGLGNAYEVEQVTFAANLLRQLVHDEVDLLHVQDPLVALIVQTAYRFGLVRTRVVLGHGTEEPLRFLSRFDFVQHLAPWHLSQAHAAGMGRSTWTAIPNFIDTDRFTPFTQATDSTALRRELSIPTNATVILTAAAIKRSHKRVDYLVQEFARVRSIRPAFPLFLVVAGGRDAETTDLIAWARDLLGERVRFLINFPRERMPSLYRAADIFVLGSLSEMMPIALLEAAASGLPCLIHDQPVLRWMAGKGGHAIDMAVPGTLSDALVDVACSPDTRATLGAAARHHTVQTFSVDRVVDEVIKYYRTVMTHSLRPRRHALDVSTRLQQTTP